MADTAGFDKVLKLQGLSFHVQATNEGSLNQLTIIPTGLSGNNPVIKQEIDGSVTDARSSRYEWRWFPGNLCVCELRGEWCIRYVSRLCF